MDSYIDDKWANRIIASYHRFVSHFKELTSDEYHNSDSLHFRKSGFAESKGQSTVASVAC